MNSVLQALTGIPEIVEGLLDAEQDENGLTRKLTEVMLAMISTDECSPVVPADLLNAIYDEDCRWVTAHQAKNGKQQCAAEFLTFLFESIPALQKCVQFNLQIKDKLEPQMFLNVSLMTIKRMNLSTLIYLQYTTIESVNETLIVVIKRWDLDAQGKVVKDARPVEVPEPLEIYDKKSNLCADFKLSGVISHMGETSNSGHYTAYSKYGEQCLLCNDRKITQVQTTEMLEAAKIGFVLIFQKQKPEAAGGLPGARMAGPAKKPPMTRREEKQPVIVIEDDEPPVAVVMPAAAPVVNERAAEVCRKRTLVQTFFDDMTRVAAGCALARLRKAPPQKPEEDEKKPAPEEDDKFPLKKAYI